MKKVILLAGMALAVTACTNNVSESWTSYSSASLNSVELADNQSLAVFYRTEELQGPAVNIYINGEYQVSLLDKGYSPITLCAKNQLITASYSYEGFGNRTKGHHYDLPVKEIAYFKGVTKSGEIAFEQMDADVARKELETLNGKVSHALSRVTHNKNCN